MNTSIVFVSLASVPLWTPALTRAQIMARRVDAALALEAMRDTQRDLTLDRLARRHDAR